MIARLLGPVLGLLAFVILFYASPFWPFRLWQGNLADLPSLAPDGNLVGYWLQGTPLASFDRIIWALGSFALLTLLQMILDRLTRH